MYVTLAQANLHLRRTETVDDADVLLKIEAASEAVAHFLSHERDTPYIQATNSAGQALFDSAGYPILAEDSAGNPIVKRTVQQATLLLLGEFYRSRDGEQQGGIDPTFGMLPRPVVALLYPSHTPVIA